MIRQKSFIDKSAKLYLVATPIGNLDDMTFRAIETLKNVSVCFAEDTRVTKVLFDHFQIKTRLECYQEFNKEKATEDILNYLSQGIDVALVSDAGNPIISDPGFLVAKEAITRGYSVIPIPGVSASLTALIASKIPANCFMFYGFLDSKKTKRIKELEDLKLESSTLIFYEAPHRIKDTLTDMLEVLGDREICLARELTKKFEEFLRGPISEILEVCDTLKGEMVIVVSGASDEIQNELDPIEQIDELIIAGMNKNNAIKMVAKRCNLDKQELYKDYINKKAK